MDPPTRSDLEALADGSDLDSRETYLSVHADFGTVGWEQAIQERFAAIEATLADEALASNFEEASDDALETVRGLEGRSGIEAGAVYASPVHGFRRVEALPFPVGTDVALDASPYLRPLARALDAYEALLVVLVDGSQAVIYEIAAGVPRKVESERTDVMGRHKKGGFSQKRFQRRRREAQGRFLEGVADSLRILLEGGPDRVIVAGPGVLKGRFVDELPAPVADAVEAVEDVDFQPGPDEVEMDRFVELGRQLEAEDSEETLAALRSELRRGGLAVEGPFEVARAARDGRVEVLVAGEDAVFAARKCLGHDAYFGSGEVCQCGSDGTKVDLVEEAVEDVMATEGEVEFVDDDGAFLEAVGGLGAIVRW